VVSLALARAREDGMRAFISMRLNDLHFADTSTYQPAGQGDFWLEHPHFWMGSYPGWHADGALNFAYRRVRQYKLELLRECCTRFRPDGVELDFMRFPVYFPFGRGRQYLDRMTDFVRRARELAGDAALIVRLPPRLSACNYLGLDPLRWVHEGLIDGITLAPFHTTDPLIPVDTFRHALGSPEIAIAAGVDTGLYHQRQPMSHGHFRGVAQQAWDAGADAVYLFNFRPDSFEAAAGDEAAWGPNRALLKELGSLETLRGRNAVFSLGEALSEYEIPHNSPLPRLLPVTLPFRLPRDLAAAERARLVLRVHPQGAPLAGAWNDHALVTEADDAAELNLQRCRGVEVRSCMLPGDVLQPGMNELHLTAAGGDAHLLRVELHVRFGPVATCGYF
jgi:hypothetical protein